MSYRDAIKRALATFVAGATATPLAAAILDLEVLKVAAVAGIIAVWNLTGRLAQAWLNTHPEA